MWAPGVYTPQGGSALSSRGLGPMMAPVCSAPRSISPAASFPSALSQRPGWLSGWPPAVPEVAASAHNGSALDLLSISLLLVWGALSHTQHPLGCPSRGDSPIQDL